MSIDRDLYHATYIDVGAVMMLSLLDKVCAHAGFMFLPGNISRTDKFENSTLNKDVDKQYLYHHLLTSMLPARRYG